MKSLLLPLLLAVCYYGNSEVPPKLLVTVYYESKCSDSSTFIEEQLLPAVHKFQNYIKVQLVPFGKAHSEDNGYQGFHCQHGPPECLGNLVQDCTLHHMQDRTDLDKVSYVNCEMTATETAEDWMCVKNALVPVHLVQDCINSDKGRKLQLISEEATKELDPSFIPTITINNEFSQEIQDKCMEDFDGTLCSMIHGCEEDHD